MSKILLVTLAASLAYFPMTYMEKLQAAVQAQAMESVIPPIKPINEDLLLSAAELRQLLHEKAPMLSEVVIDKVVTSLKCANQYNVDHNDILTVIDYSLPSSEKRLWVFDLKHKQLLFYTYVSHGIKSGTLLTDNFSNKYNSKASSIGVYKTEKAYYGREGLSLRLDGLDRSFNDNASNRSVVMHGGWYVTESFIKKYGRPGRSWGCPALPLEEYKGIINTIKENSLFVVYYPSEDWFSKSKFLNCNNPSKQLVRKPLEVKAPGGVSESREEVLLADLTQKNKSEQNKAVLAMSAADYERTFHNKPPLDRMLRRQINQAEYIALSNKEFASLSQSKDDKGALSNLYFIIPVIKMVRGYYETQMEIMPFGKIKEVRLSSDAASKRYTVYFDKQPALTLKATDQFIRWLGL